MPIVVTTEWLREFVPTDLPAKEIADRLSDVGLATDSFEEIEGGEARLELEAPTNRGDCWSVLGVAREFASALGAELKLPALDYESSGTPASDEIAVRVEDADLCPRYTARLIRGVSVGPSPEWMRKRLEAVGIRPISNVVDVTNYVLVETGQPLHAFDMSLLSGDKVKTIVVRRARDNEGLPLLDETTKELTAEDLVIADADRAVALAGVMGGADTEIRADTRDVLLESAQFNRISVRRTARRHGCPTESSVRFEHGVDPLGVDIASRRAAHLFAEVAGGKVAPGVVGPDPAWAAPEIALRHARVSKLLCGNTAAIPDEEITRILKSLGLELVREEEAERDTITTWRAPSWRQELEIEVDLIEEVARVYGYNRLPGKPTMRVFPVRPHPMFEARKKVRDVLTSQGYTEVSGASFFSDERARFWCLAAGYVDEPLRLLDSQGPAHRIRNPVRLEEASLRTSLVPSLLAAKVANQNLGRKCVRIFEAAPVCVPNAEGSLEHLALLDDGVEGADKSDEEVLRRAQGALDALVERFCPDGRAELGAVTEHDLAETDRAYDIMLDGTPLGVLGAVNRDTAEAWQLETCPALLEINLWALASKAKGAPQAGDLPRFPGIARDVALIVDEANTWAEIDADACGLARHEWRSTPRFLSLYRGKQIGPGRKSVAFRVVYRAPDRTLTDEEVKPVHDEFVSKLCASLGAEIRE